MNLSGNSFSGPLPSQWHGNDERMPWLELDLSRNNISGVLPEWRGGDIPQIPVTILNLSHNQISGSIPDDWANKLPETMDLSHNLLQGLLPFRTESNLPSDEVKLRNISLSNNSFSGSLPPEWTSLGPLVHVDLSHNNISGDLPPDWQKMSNLRTLNLSSNGLTGELPSSWEDMFVLQHLDISNNKLKGTLPGAWSNLRKMVIMKLQNNHLTGPLPGLWGELRRLEMMILDGNQLSGHLPKEYGAMTRMRHMSISNNRLTEGLPSTFSQLEAVEFLNLSHNPLRGGVPVSWYHMGSRRANPKATVNVDLTETRVELQFVPTSMREDLCASTARDKLKPNITHPHGANLNVSLLLHGQGSGYLMSASPDDKNTICADHHAKVYVGIVWGIFLLGIPVAIIIGVRKRASTQTGLRTWCCIQYQLVDNPWRRRWQGSFSNGKLLALVTLSLADCISDILLAVTVLPSWPAYVMIASFLLPDLLCSYAFARYWTGMHYISSKRMQGSCWATALTTLLALVLVPVFPILVLLLAGASICGRRDVWGINIHKVCNLHSGAVASTEGLFSVVFNTLAYVLIASSPGLIQGVFILRFNYLFSITTSMAHILFSLWRLSRAVKVHGWDTAWVRDSFHRLGSGKEDYNSHEGEVREREQQGICLNLEERLPERLPTYLEC